MRFSSPPQNFLLGFQPTMEMVAVHVPTLDVQLMRPLRNPYLNLIRRRMAPTETGLEGFSFN